jgi:hypothetical protein
MDIKDLEPPKISSNSIRPKKNRTSSFKIKPRRRYISNSNSGRSSKSASTADIEEIKVSLHEHFKSIKLLQDALDVEFIDPIKEETKNVRKKKPFEKSSKSDDEMKRKIQHIEKKLIELQTSDINSPLNRI